MPDLRAKTSERTLEMLDAIRDYLGLDSRSQTLSYLIARHHERIALSQDIADIKSRAAKILSQGMTKGLLPTEIQSVTLSDNRITVRVKFSGEPYSIPASLWWD